MTEETNETVMLSIGLGSDNQMLISHVMQSSPAMDIEGDRRQFLADFLIYAVSLARSHGFHPDSIVGVVQHVLGLLEEYDEYQKQQSQR